MRDGKNNAMQVFIIFVGSSPHQGDIFFLKSDIKWAFSYTLEIQRSGQPQNSKIGTKNREIAIAIYLC